MVIWKESIDMRRVFATAALGASLGVAPALAQGVIPPIDASCPATAASTVRGTLLKSSPVSLTMTVESGKGPLLAFGAAQLMLPVAPNATVVGAPRKGDTVVVQAFACPNAAKTSISMVAGRIELKSRPAGKTTTARKTVAGKKPKPRR
jgi:hypothetical protein